VKRVLSRAARVNLMKNIRGQARARGLPRERRKREGMRGKGRRAGEKEIGGGGGSRRKGGRNRQKTHLAAKDHSLGANGSVPLLSSSDSRKMFPFSSGSYSIFRHSCLLRLAFNVSFEAAVAANRCSWRANAAAEDLRFSASEDRNRRITFER